MVFAMKEGGSQGGLECHIPILKDDFFENHLESFRIVGSQRPELLMNVNFEPIIRGLKSDIFEV